MARSLIRNNLRGNNPAVLREISAGDNDDDAPSVFDRLESVMGREDYIRWLKNDALGPNLYEVAVAKLADLERLLDGNPDSEEGKLLLLGVRTKVLHDRLFLEDYLRGCQCSKFVEAFGIGLSCYYCEENARIMAEKGVELVF
jgi:hypothetical protein